MRKVFFFVLVFCLVFPCAEASEENSITKFSIKSGQLHLGRPVQPHRYFESTGQQSAIMGTEDGNFEVWIYPYKVLHNFKLHFLMEDENEMIEGQKIANRVDIYPHQSILRYVHSSFKAEAILFTPLKESGIVLLLSVETIKPLSIIASFTPDLKPMWPAGLGGQYSYWDRKKKYFVISEGTRKNVALVGSPDGEQFSTGPAHALPEGDMRLKIHIEPEDAKQLFFPIFISASHEGRKRADEIYVRLKAELKELYLEKFRHFERLEKEHFSVLTPDDKLNKAFQWAKVAVDKAFVCNPQLGCGLIAGYGLSGRSERPGFAWFFGGDAFYNAWALTSIGAFNVIRRSLAFIRKNQRQDGKIMHELSQGAAFIPWFEEYPYGFYHAETTPYYIVSLYNYLNCSGDIEFIKESWPSIKKAYQYILSSDTDADGLMENTVAGLAALELGAFLKETKTDIYLAALSVEAHRVFSKLSLLMGAKKLSEDAEKAYRKSLTAIREKFWVEAEKRYAHALTVENKPLMETTIWPSMPLFFKQFPQDRADYVLDLFASSEMSTDWGVRTLSPNSSYYDPLNYNYGTVWPFLTGYVCLSEYNYDHSLSGFSHLSNLAHNNFIDALGYCSELFSGEFFTPIEESVPHQIWSSSCIITCLVRGLFGLKGNAQKREIEFRPNIPGNWNKARIRNFCIGDDLFHFSAERNGNKLVMEIETKASVPYRLYFSPLLGFGSSVRAVRINGRERVFRIEENRGEVRCVLDLEIKEKTLIEIETQRSIFLYLPHHFPQMGDKTSGLKIIRAQYRDNQLKIIAEGLVNNDYTLNVITTRFIHSVRGAELTEEGRVEKKIKINFESQEGGYIRKEIFIRFE